MPVLILVVEFRGAESTGPTDAVTVRNEVRLMVPTLIVGANFFSERTMFMEWPPATAHIHVLANDANHCSLPRIIHVCNPRPDASFRREHLHPNGG